MRKCSSLIKMQIKTAVRYHLTLVRMAIITSQQITNAGEGMEKREPSFTVGGNINWLQPLQKTVWRYLRKLCRKTNKQTNKNYIELPYDLAIPLLCICPEETFVEKDTRTPIFIAALFTIAKTWKQPKCPSINK